MSNKRVNLRLLLLYDFKSGLNATQSCQRINSAFGDGKIALRTAQHWFKEFSKGRENVQDNARSGRPSTVNDTKIKDLILNDPHLTSIELNIRHEGMDEIVFRPKVSIFFEKGITDLKNKYKKVLENDDKYFY